MPAYSDISPILSRYAGSGNTLLARINECRARLMQSGNWKGSKELTTLRVYSDVDGNSIVTLPRKYQNILAGAIRSDDVLCSGTPLGVLNNWTEYDPNGLGYGGLSNNFTEVPGRFAIFQEWEDQMLIRLKFETSESSGVVHLLGKFDGEDVYSLYSGSWILGEKIAISGTTTVTSTKLFDAIGFAATKPVTNGRISVYCVDSDGNETLVGLWEPTETVPRRKRYKVPTCDDTSATTSATAATPSQYYTKAEILDFFKTETAISVSAVGTHDLVYNAYLLRIVPITVAAGSGSYTHNFTLDNATVKDGGTLRVRLSVAASANPILKFYDNTTSGTLLYEVDGDSSNVQNFSLVFTYDGTNAAWNFNGREL